MRPVSNDARGRQTGWTREGLAFVPLHAKAEQPADILWRSGRPGIAVFQRIDHPDPAAAAAMARAEADGGAHGLTLALAGSLGARTFGLRGETSADLAAVLDKVDPEQILLAFEVPAVDGATSGLMLDALQGAGIRPNHPSLDLAADPVTAAILGGEDPRSAAAAARRWVTDLGRHGVAAGLLRADGRPHHEAGATAVQELAAVLSVAVLHLRALEAIGLPPDDALRFTLAADADQNLTIAKFRAFRRLWARVEAACGLTPRPVRLHGETSWRILTRQDPWTNLLRNAVACAAAIIGGADSITVLPFTSALGLPDASARRLARNTPLVLIEEAHLGRVADASAGAGAFEALTDTLCGEAWRLFQGLEAGGGLVEALVSGAWAREIAAARAARAERRMADGHELVGVTAFAPPPDAPVPPVLLPMSAPSPGQAPVRHLGPGRDAETIEPSGPELRSSDMTP